MVENRPKNLLQKHLHSKPNSSSNRTFTSKRRITNKPRRNKQSNKPIRIRKHSLHFQHNKLLRAARLRQYNRNLKAMQNKQNFPLSKQRLRNLLHENNRHA